MTETFADAVDRLQGILAEQVDAWRRLLQATREGNRVLGSADPDAFGRVLAEQVETLRDLKELADRREATLREVGPAAEAGEDGLREELRRLAVEVSRATRVGRLVLERNGALVEARLALHRRAGRKVPSSAAGVDRMA